MEYIMKAVSVPGFNAQQQIECALEGGLICHRLGLWRKYAFFLFIAALMSADNDNYGVAQALVSEFIFCCLTLLVSFLTYVGGLLLMLLLFWQLCYACNECGISTESDGLTPLQISNSVVGTNRITGDYRSSDGLSGAIASSKRFVKWVSPAERLKNEEMDKIEKQKLTLESGNISTPRAGSLSPPASPSASPRHKRLSSTGPRRAPVGAMGTHGDGFGKNNSSWVALRASLFSTAALVADERGDSLTAAQ
jgi:hypothetical protein